MGWFSNYLEKRERRKEEKRQQEERKRVERQRREKVERKTRMLRKATLSLVILFTLTLYFSYKNNFFVKQKSWITTKQGSKVWMFNDDNIKSVSWQGNSFGGLINGNGILEISSNGDKETKRVSASYGSIDKNDWKKEGNGFYMGELEFQKAGGFGVLKQSEKLYIGMFKKGKVEGKTQIFINDSPIYSGNFSDNNYNGVGSLYKDGNFQYGEWKNGHLKESFFSKQTKSFGRLWNRLTKGKVDDESSKQIAKSEIYKLDKNDFVEQFLAGNVETYVEDQIKNTVEDRTDFFSIEPIRMFWESIFTTREKREKGWFTALQNNGLSADDINFFINSSIKDYNENNIYKEKLNEVHIDNFKIEKIVTDETFQLIDDLEHAGWANNFWFDSLLAFFLSFILTSIISFFVPIIVVYAKVFDIAVGVLAFIVAIILNMTGALLTDDTVASIYGNIVDQLTANEILDKILIK